MKYLFLTLCVLLFIASMCFLDRADIDKDGSIAFALLILSGFSLMTAYLVSPRKPKI